MRDLNYLIINLSSTSTNFERIIIEDKFVNNFSCFQILGPVWYHAFVVCQNCVLDNPSHSNIFKYIQCKDTVNGYFPHISHNSSSLRKWELEMLRRSQLCLHVAITVGMDPWSDFINIITRPTKLVIIQCVIHKLFQCRYSSTVCRISEISLPTTRKMIVTYDHHKHVLCFMLYYYWFDMDFNVFILALVFMLHYYWFDMDVNALGTIL